MIIESNTTANARVSRMRSIVHIHKTTRQRYTSYKLGLPVHAIKEKKSKRKAQPSSIRPACGLRPRWRSSLRDHTKNAQQMEAKASGHIRESGIPLRRQQSIRRVSRRGGVCGKRGSDARRAEPTCLPPRLSLPDVRISSCSVRRRVCVGEGKQGLAWK
jgi:hypothetical protein